MAVAGFGITFYRFDLAKFKVWLSYLGMALLAYAAVKITPLLFDVEAISRSYGDLHSLNARWPMWQSTLELIKASPWWGQGFGSFSVLYPAVRTEFMSAGYVAHNDYLQIWLEGGGFLFALFSIWVLFHFYLLFRVLVLKHGPQSSL